ncbi:MAG: hypothetical protein HY005_02570 [Candidatus Staskawiczbacteria bacterium]|nr:hypothetical protein [Candidatus Staskawiczbacteria bacterium]MBI3337482.1 hypothetical protein [Candidatus Staskawiczbacteria bacterium]
MSRKAKMVIASSYVVLLVIVCVLGYNLYETYKWNDIYFRHMMQAEGELDRVRVIDFTDQRFGTAYKIRISRNEVKIEPVMESHSVTIPNPLFKAPPVSQVE